MKLPDAQLITLRIPHPLYARVKARAVQDVRSANSTLICLIEDGLDKADRAAPPDPALIMRAAAKAREADLEAIRREQAAP